MQSRNYSTTIITADEGMFITQKEDVDILERIIGTRIALPASSCTDDFVEITKEKADEYEQLKKVREEELHQEALAKEEAEREAREKAYREETNPQTEDVASETDAERTE